MKEKKSPLNTTLVTQHPMGLAATRLTTLQSSLVVVEKRLEMNTLYTILEIYQKTKQSLLNSNLLLLLLLRCTAQSKPMYATI